MPPATLVILIANVGVFLLGVNTFGPFALWPLGPNFEPFQVVTYSFLHANMDRTVSVAEPAREACLSPFHFHRLFTSFHGITPHRYLTRLRLARARSLLRSSERSVADVACACGFESLGSFTTLFTRTIGVSPARFRRIEEAP